MKNSALVLLLTHIFTSCSKQVKEKPCFEYVDISFSDTWSIKASVRVDSSKEAHILVDKRGEGKTYYVGKIKDSAFYKINSLINSALTIKHDTQIGLPVPDGSLSGIIIQVNKSIAIKTLLFDHDVQTKLDTIITELGKIDNYILNRTQDTSFSFLSYDLITPKMEPVEFVPPVIKDDVTEK